MTEHAKAVLGLNVTPFMRGLSKAKTGMGKFKAAMQSSLGFFGIGFGLATLGRTITNFADRLVDTSQKLGVSTDFLQAWNFSAQKIGVSTQSSNMALQRFTRRIGEAARGQGVLFKTMTELGIELRDNDGRMRSTTDVLADYADAVKNAESQQERLRLAFQAFDSEGAALVTLLQDGSAGLQQMRRDAEQMGAVVNQRALFALNRLSIGLKTLAQQSLGILAEKVGGLLDGLERIAAFYGARSAGVNPTDAYNLAAAQVDVENSRREQLAMQREMTDEAQTQVDLEKQKADAIREQINLQRKEQSDRESGKEQSFADAVKETWKINRQREMRARRLMFQAGSFAEAAEGQRGRARLEHALGNTAGWAQALSNAVQFQRRANQLSRLADSEREAIFNPLENIQRLRERHRNLTRAGELESDAERMRRFGFAERAREFVSRANEIRESEGLRSIGPALNGIHSDVGRIATAIEHLNQ